MAAAIQDDEPRKRLEESTKGKSTRHLIYFEAPSQTFQWVTVVFASFINNLLLTSDLISSYRRVEAPDSCVLSYCSSIKPPVCGLMGRGQYYFLPETGNPLIMDSNTTQSQNIYGGPFAIFANQISICYSIQYENTGKLDLSAPSSSLHSFSLISILLLTKYPLSYQNLHHLIYKTLIGVFSVILYAFNGAGLIISVIVYLWIMFSKASAQRAAHALLACTIISTVGEFIIMEYIFIPTLRLVGCTGCFGNSKIAAQVFPLMLSILINNFLQFYMDICGFGDYETMKIAATKRAKVMFGFIILFDTVNTIWNIVALGIAFNYS